MFFWAGVARVGVEVVDLGKERRERAEKEREKERACVHVGVCARVCGGSRTGWG